MTSTATAAGQPPAPKNLLARFIGIIVVAEGHVRQPRPVPKWFGMLALTAVHRRVLHGAADDDRSRPPGRDRSAGRSRCSRSGFTVSDQMYEQMQKGAARMPYTTGGGVVVVTPIMAVIIAGILFAIFNAALGGEASFKQVFAVLVARRRRSRRCRRCSPARSTTCAAPMTSVANLGALLPMLPEKSFAGAAARRGRYLPDLVDRRPGHRTGGAVPAPHAADRDLAAVVYVVIALCIARRSRAGAGGA